MEDIGFGFKDGLRYRNIVSSKYIADAQIEFVSKGSLNDAQKEFVVSEDCFQFLILFNMRISSSICSLLFICFPSLRCCENQGSY